MPPPPAPAAPPQPAPEAAGVHPDFLVPPSAPYTTYTVDDLLSQPAREGLEILNPDRPPGLESTTEYGRSVYVTIKGYFVETHPNWTLTSEHVRTRWFKKFVDKWEYYVYEVKPTEITKDVWDGLIAYWNLPTSIDKANKCSAFSRTKDEEGHLPMVEKIGVLPSLFDLFKLIHGTPAETFADPASEKLFNEVAARVEGREMQLTQQSPDGLLVKLSQRRSTRSSTRRDHETSRMQARIDALQRAVGYPLLQRALEQRRETLGMGQPPPESTDRGSMETSGPYNYDGVIP
uniref:Uncharacterized protein n=2 Tax=Brassica TaxID=3705 RepID=A0A0D3C0Q2_BRAOL